MPTIRFNEVLAAGGAVQNAVNGSQFEFLGRASAVQVYMAADGVGVGQAEVFFGQEIVLPQSIVPEAAAGFGPAVPDDLVVDEVGAGGDRIVIRLTETGGAAGKTIRGMVKITPIPM